METEKGPGWRLRNDWLASGAWMQRPFPKAIRHRGHVYPERFEVTWVRDDGLEVELDIKVLADRGPIPMAATVRAPQGIGGEYRQPIPSMVRTAAAQIAYVEPEPGTLTPAPARLIPMGEPTKRTDDARLERVAGLYRRAMAEGRKVTELIQENEHVGTATAYGLIAQARKAGKLPPSPPGRKAKNDE